MLPKLLAGVACWALPLSKVNDSLLPSQLVGIMLFLEGERLCHIILPVTIRFTLLLTSFS